ncbi:MAG: tRNA-guanine transglycosylase, partial [Candidatus Sumerlaeia bacterium]|nr:tRNA-guanine transglycosylase [Candidatus Sumerlaeia bacterium]
FISPEVSMSIQRALGANIVMAFDECPSCDMEGKALVDSTDRTLRWLERCATVPLKDHQCMFPIVQGGMNPELRVDSARRTLSIIPDAVGYAVGGLAVGEARATTYDMLEVSLGEMPQDKPRYMMGIGTPEDLVWAVDRGVDLFDCVLPTRNARNAKVFHPGGNLNMRNAKFRDDPRPLLEGCDCHSCATGFSRAYIHHLHKCDEMMGGILCSIHNIRYLIRQCTEMRNAIIAGKWEEWRGNFFETNPHVPQKPGGPIADAKPTTS